MRVLPKVLAAMGLICAGGSALAQHEPEEHRRDDPPPWSVTLSTYGWLAGFSGRSRPFAQAPTVSFDKSFSDVWDSLDAMLFANVMARRGRFVMLGDLTHTSSSASGRIAALPGLEARGSYDQDTLLGLAGYRVQESATHAFDLYGGLRLWRVRSSASASLAGQTVVAAEDRFWWLDPVLAARYRQALGERGELLGYGDVGGFGLGSDLSWQLLVLYNHRVHARWTLSGGYRVLSTDYDDDGHLHDVRIAGPLLGLTWHF